MRKSFAIVISFIFAIGCRADSNATSPVKPEKVHRIVYEVESNEWYQQQSELWEKEIEKNPGNEDAWYNYYNANRYAFFEEIDRKDRKARRDNIIENMGKAIPETYTYYLLKYWDSCDMKDMSLVEKAYAMDPERPDTYYPFLSNAAIHGDDAKFKEFCDKLYNSQDIAPWLYNYNYNVLMSLEPGAILFTNGDNDTYPIWVQQQTKGIRDDVTVLNVSLCRIESYLDYQLKRLGVKTDAGAIIKKCEPGKSNTQEQFNTALLIDEILKLVKTKDETIPVHFALTVNKQHIKNLLDELYIVGLAYKFSPNRFDNLAVLKKNFERRFRLDYLDFDWYADKIPGKNLMNNINLNYVAPILMLAEHYKASGQMDDTERWKALALDLAEKSGNAELMGEINKKLR